MKHILFFSIFWIYFQLLNGQSFELLNSANSGLIEDDLLSISVDKNGNKWIGTSNSGLVKYDGKDFISYNMNNSPIKGNYVAPIFVDSKGHIWVSFSKPTEGLAMFNGTQWKNFEGTGIPKSIISICESKTGELFFGGSEGVTMFDGNNWNQISIPFAATVRTLDINNQNELAIGHNSGLLIQSNGSWKSFNSDNSELALNTVRAVKYISSNKLLIGYGGGFGNGGFSIYDEGNWVHYNRTNSNLSDHMIRDIEVDNNGTYWMASNNGLMQLEKKKVKPQFFRNGQYKNVILDVAVEQSTLWVATNFGLVKMN